MISGIDDAQSVVRCPRGRRRRLPAQTVRRGDPCVRASTRARPQGPCTTSSTNASATSSCGSCPEQMVDEVLARTDGDARIRPELLTGTVLFGDLRGFTSYAEGRAVEEVIEAINTYLTLMTDAVLDHGGTIVDYMGDGIMAAFGAPVANEEHAELSDRGCSRDGRRAAGDVQRVALLHRGGRAAPDGDRDQLGAGAVGERRLAAAPDYAVIGDTTNTASRIEAMTKQLDHAVLFSQGTKDALREAPEDAVSLGAFEIRGGAGASSSGPSTSRSRRDRARRRDPARSARTRLRSSRPSRATANAPSACNPPSTGSPRRRAPPRTCRRSTPRCIASSAS